MEGDLRKLQNNYYVVNEVIQTLFKDARQGDSDGRLTQKALQLFEAAWDAFPSNRTFLLSEVRHDSIWRPPMMIDYAKVALVPQTVQEAVANPWKVVVGSLETDMKSSRPQGIISGNLNRLCAALDQQKRVEEFRKVVASAVEQFPGWHGGKLLLAVLYEREGQSDLAQQQLRSIKQSSTAPFIPSEVALLVGIELRTSTGPLLNETVALLESSSRPTQLAAPSRICTLPDEC